ncbi:MAG: nuclear transport factor 2 family protein [Phenylobacterium sp.]|uniref:nuclear transport factor 2 family protein n=1 Tax=Phenylobacterium sp. TaxID=1871053 RepID=UPI00391CB916
MTATDELIDRYIAAWNETDPNLRRDLIARTWRADGSYLDPVMAGDGVEGIDAMIAGVQARFPGFVMRRVGEVDAHNDRVRFGWALGPDGGEPVVGGTDFGVTDGERLAAITGFIDFAPA